jgi:hypothetical protein
MSGDHKEPFNNNNFGSTNFFFQKKFKRIKNLLRRNFFLRKATKEYIVIMVAIIIKMVLKLIPHIIRKLTLLLNSQITIDWSKLTFHNISPIISDHKSIKKLNVSREMITSNGNSLWREVLLITIAKFVAE